VAHDIRWVLHRAECATARSDFSLDGARPSIEEVSAFFRSIGASLTLTS